MSADSVAVIGAGGFIGTNLCRELRDRDYRVRALSRSWITPPAAGLDAAITSDVNDPGAIAEAISDCKSVVFLPHGSLPGTALDSAGRDMIQSLSTTLELIACCVSRGAKLVYLSSGGTVYGPSVPIPSPEEVSCNPINIYGVSKLATEKVLAVYGRQQALDYQVLRVSNPYGPWQLGRKGQGVIGTWLSQAISGQKIEVWGDGSVVRDYVYIDDVVRAIVAAIGYKGGERVFNVGSGKGATLREVLGIIQEMCEVDVEYGAARAVDVPASILDVSRAVRELGWEPVTSLRDGIRDSLEWARATAGLR